MARRSAMTVHGWLELLATIELERRAYRAQAESFSRLRNVVKAAGFVVQADEAAQEILELRATAIAEGVPAEAIAREMVEAWGIANLNGGPQHRWEWDAEQDLPESLA